jgi:hypothetical protein
MTEPRPAPQPDNPERAAEAALAAAVSAPDPLEGPDSYGWGV